MTFWKELFLPLSVSASLLAGESGTSAVAAELIERSSASFQEGSMKIVNFDVPVFNINIYLQVEPGKPGAEVSKKKNYKSKKEFAYRMCTG